MMKDDEILAEFAENVEGFFGENNAQRREIRTSFYYMDGHRVEDEIEARQTKKRDRSRSKPNINMSSAIVRAAAGSDVMQERKLDVVAIDNADYDKDADIMADCVEYAQQVSAWKSNRGLASRDSMVCGIAATVSYLDMSRRDVASGVPQCKRIYPGFLFYDNSGRGNDLNSSANWCGYGDPMRMKDLQKYVTEKTSDKTAVGGDAFAGLFLSDLRDNNADLGMLYHYFWRAHAPVFDVKNPLAEQEDGQPSILSEIVSQDDVAIEFLAQFADMANVDIDAPYWTLDADEKRELEKVIADIAKLVGTDIALEMTSRKVWCYYRAEIALGAVLSKSKSYSQECYPLNFITGYYDEHLGIYYGLMRHLSFVQDALNHVMDDTLEYARGVATGGKVYVSGMGDDIKAMIKAKANEEDVTPLPEGALVTPKAAAATPQVLLETARMLLDLLPRAVGLGPEFLGIITSGAMTDSLYGKIIRQNFAVLEDFANSSVGYAMRQGILFRDMMMGVARAEEGRILPVLSPGHQGEDYIRISKQNMARQYVIRVVERPISDDQKQEMVRIITQLIPHMGAAVVPILVENLPIDQQQKEKMLQAVTPQPAPQNPLDIESIKANIRLLNAQSAKLEGDALTAQAKLDSEDEKIQSEIEKNVASAQKSLADAGKAQSDMIYQWIAQPKGMTNDGRNASR